MATLGQMYANKDTREGIAVNKTFMVPFDKLYVEEDYNIRDIDQAHVEEFAEAFAAGEYLPAMTVEVTARGVKILDGHHRYHGAKLAIERGHEVLRIECKDFVGSEADKIAFMVTSSQGKQLSPIERANAYLRLKNQGWTNEEIAKKVKRSVSDVQQHLSLSGCAPEILDKINKRQMSYATGIELQRTHGANAGIAADEAMEKALKEGKSKVTKAVTAPQFSAKQARRLVELMSNYKVMWKDGYCYLEIDKGALPEVDRIMAEYNKE